MTHRFETWHDYQALGLVSLLFHGRGHPVRLAAAFYQLQLFGIRRLVDAVSVALLEAHEFGQHDRHELDVERENKDLWHVIERVAKELHYGLSRELLLRGNDGFALTSRVRRLFQGHADMERRETLRGAIGRGLPKLWLRCRDYSSQERELINGCLTVEWYENTDPELRLYVRDYLPSEREHVERCYANVRWIEEPAAEEELEKLKRENAALRENPFTEWWEEPAPMVDPEPPKTDPEPVKGKEGS